MYGEPLFELVSFELWHELQEAVNMAFGKLSQFVEAHGPELILQEVGDLHLGLGGQPRLLHPLAHRTRLVKIVES